MFAFALWDGESQKLLLARDRFGEKPLFTAKTQSGSFLVASEMKALLRHPEVSNNPNNSAIQSFSNGYWPESDSETFFEGIQRFDQNTWALYSKEGNLLKTERFWKPEEITPREGLTLLSATEEFSALLTESVKLRLNADVPVGSSLSGGLDSSTITGLVAQARGRESQPQHTFSAVFPTDPTISEALEVHTVAEYLSVPSHLVAPTPEGLEADSRILHWHQEEPFESASIYLQWSVARLAAENGVTVLLDGQGADELLGGYQHYIGAFQGDLVRSGKGIDALKQTANLRKKLTERSSEFHDSHRRFSADPGLSNLQLVEAILRSALGSVFRRPSNSLGEAREAMNHSLFRHGLPTLLRYADRNSMAFSREVRLPFLDTRLVDFCLSLPTGFFSRMVGRSGCCGRQRRG